MAAGDHPISRPLGGSDSFSGWRDTENAWQHAFSSGLQLRRNEIVLNTTLTWANSAVVNTAVNSADFTLNGDWQIGVPRFLMVYVRNPSTQTTIGLDITMKVLDSATNRYGLFRDGVVQQQGGDVSTNVGEWFGPYEPGMFALGGRITGTNLTVLNGSGGFSARVVVYHV
jgi:hypothetical protein